MVKSINFIDKLIFNYLGKDNTALFLSQTGFFMDCELNDGVLWAQFNDENKIIYSKCMLAYTRFCAKSTDYAKEGNRY